MKPQDVTWQRALGLGCVRIVAYVSPLGDIIVLRSACTQVQLVVLPEGAHHECGAASLEANALLAEMSEVVARHRCD